ncbi:GNAT family N-acetyltransferase [Flavobacterium sp.]|uniref:GNAT family N-acetyltransferase n=1 Tax=Flavobacterium sp. TaxID=239 RepID=UPI0039E25699
MTITYRTATESDKDYLVWLRKATMENHLINSGISLRDEDQLLRVNYLFDQAKIILYKGQNIGLLKLDEKENNVEIVQVQIDPQFQGKGIGRQIIQSVIENSLNRNKQISLSVLKQNPAKELYLRMGFKIIGEDDSSYLMQFES